MIVDGSKVSDQVSQSCTLAVTILTPPAVSASLPAGEILFKAPENPHAGCFVLSSAQLQYWSEQPWYQDLDCGFVSPLESAATLGLLKTFQVYKPALTHANWLELQHWGRSFRMLVGQSVKPMAS